MRLPMILALGLAACDATEAAYCPGYTVENLAKWSQGGDDAWTLSPSGCFLQNKATVKTRSTAYLSRRYMLQPNTKLALAVSNQQSGDGGASVILYSYPHTDPMNPGMTSAVLYSGRPTTIGVGFFDDDLEIKFVALANTGAYTLTVDNVSAEFSPMQLSFGGGCAVAPCLDLAGSQGQTR